jgi:hypothetical protein
LGALNTGFFGGLCFGSGFGVLGSGFGVLGTCFLGRMYPVGPCCFCGSGGGAFFLYSTFFGSWYVCLGAYLGAGGAAGLGVCTT